MQNPLVLTKLEFLDRCISRIQEHTPENMAEFIVNQDHQDIVLLNLERSVQLCVDIISILLSERHLPVPATMRTIFSSAQEVALISAPVAANMQSAVGFRNIAVHQYNKLDLAQVYQIAIQAPSDLKEFGAEIVALAD